jgi:hypothetical protein
MFNEEFAVVLKLSDFVATQRSLLDWHSRNLVLHKNGKYL